MITVGVDTHKHQHIAVALDALGQLLGEIAVAATVAGYRELVFWLAGLGGEAVVGIEGTGSPDGTRPVAHGAIGRGAPRPPAGGGQETGGAAEARFAARGRRGRCR